MQRDYHATQYEFYRDRYAPYYVEPPPSTYYRPRHEHRPYPYGEYARHYLASSSRARRARSISPFSGTSNSSKDVGAHCQRNIQVAAAGVVRPDQFPPIAVEGMVAGNAAMTFASPAISGHAPVSTVPTPVTNARAEEDDVPLSQLLRKAASQEPPEENVGFYPTHIIILLVIGHIGFYLNHELITICMTGSDMCHEPARAKSQSESI